MKKLLFLLTVLFFTVNIYAKPHIEPGGPSGGGSGDGSGDNGTISNPIERWREEREKAKQAEEEEKKKKEQEAKEQLNDAEETAEGLDQDEQQIKDDEETTSQNQDENKRKRDAETINDPANIVTGSNEFGLTDLQYSFFENEIEIKRHYSSMNNDSFSLGKGWSFNYDTRVVYGVKKDHELMVDNYNKGVAKVEEIYNYFFNETDGFFKETKEQLQTSFDNEVDHVNNNKADSSILENAEKRVLEAENRLNDSILQLEQAQAELLLLKEGRTTEEELAMAEETVAIAQNSKNEAEAALVLAMQEKQNAELALQGEINAAEDFLNDRLTDSQKLNDLINAEEGIHKNNLKSLLTQMYKEQERVIRESKIAESNYLRNIHNVENLNETYFGNNKIHIIGERGVATQYQIMNIPDYNSETLLSNGSVNYYPNGSSLKYINYINGIKSLEERGPTGETVNLNPDGTLTVRSKDLSKTTYSDTGRLLYKEDKNGNRVTFNFTGKQLNNIVDSADRTTSFVYCGNKLSTITDPLGRVYAYSYTGDHLSSYTNPEGHVYSYTYENGVMTEKISPNSSITRFEYVTTSEGNLKFVKAVDSKQNYWETLYYPGDNYTVGRDREGYETSYHYNSDKKTVKVKFYDGTYLIKEYDPNGNVTEAINRKGFKTSYEYDENQNLTKVTNPLGHTIKYTYNALNKLATITDSNGNVTKMNYDSRGNLIKKINPDGGFFEYTYNGNGPLKASTDPLGHTTQYIYDNSGNVTAVINPDNSKKTIKIDILGYVTETTNENNLTLKFKYNKLGKLTTVTDPANYSSIRKFNETGKLIEYIDPLNNVQKYMYDSNNNLIEEIDPLGNSIKYEYNSNDEVTRKVFPDGNVISYLYDGDRNIVQRTKAETRTTSYIYDSLGNTTQKTDSSGNIWRYNYDSLSRLVEVINPLGDIKSKTYDNNSNLISVTNVNGYTTTYEYDSMNNLVKEIDPLNGIKQFEYDLNGNLVKEIDKNGNITTYTYDSRNRLVQYTDGEGGVTTNRYDAGSNIIEVTDPNGNTTSYEYDSSNRVIGITDALGGRITFIYDAKGNKLSATDANGNSTYYSYDQLDRLISLTDAKGSVTKFEYNSHDKVTKVVDALGNEKIYDYNSFNELIKFIDENGANRKFVYDNSGNLLALENELGYKTTYTYDKLDRVIEETDPLNRAVSYSYDSMGNIVSRSDAMGGTNLYRYDPLNRVVKEINKLGYEKLLNYDQTGNVIEKIDYSGQKYLYQYNSNNQLIKEVQPDGNIKEFSYDLNGNRLSANNNSSLLTFTYDELNRLESYNDELIGKTLTYTYDPAGNRTSLRLNNDLAASYTYDSLNNIVEVDTGTRVFKLGYDQLGREVSRKSSNDATSMTYDNVGRMTSIEHKNGYQVVRAQSYIYDALGQNVFTVDETAQIRAYSYDPAGQLTEARYSFDQDYFKQNLKEMKNLGINHRNRRDRLERWNLSYENQAIVREASNKINPSWKYLNLNARTWFEKFSYDDNGNITSKTTPLIAISYSYNKGNQQLKAGNKVFEYDILGNLISDRVGRRSVNYLYNSENRLSEYRDREKVVNYTYDALGRRNGETIASLDPTNSIFMYDGLSLNKLREERTYTQKWRDVKELDHDYLNNQILTTNEKRWYHSHETFYRHDNIGSVIAYEEYSTIRPIAYTAFGETVNYWRWPNKENYFAYNGKTQSRVSNLYDYGYRDYSSSTGRFTTIDPIRDGNNWYAYCNNNPINFIDPNGLEIVLINPTPAKEKQLDEALDYLSQSEAGKKLVDEMQEKGFVVEIYIEDEGEVTPNVYLRKTEGTDDRPAEPGRVIWNPNTGLLVEGVGVSSPAIGLAHELGHAKQEKDGVDMDREDDKHEDDNLDENIDPICDDLGEAKRDKYEDPVRRVITNGVTSKEIIDYMNKETNDDGGVPTREEAENSDCE